MVKQISDMKTKEFWLNLKYWVTYNLKDYSTGLFQHKDTNF
jgi:hypothetical protein